MADHRYDMKDSAEKMASDIIDRVFSDIEEAMPNTKFPGDDRFEKTVAASIYNYIYEYGPKFLIRK